MCVYEVMCDVCVNMRRAVCICTHIYVCVSEVMCVCVKAVRVCVYTGREERGQRAAHPCVQQLLRVIDSAQHAVQPTLSKL